MSKLGYCVVIFTVSWTWGCFQSCVLVAAVNFVHRPQRGFERLEKPVTHWHLFICDRSECPFRFHSASTAGVVLCWGGGAGCALLVFRKASTQSISYQSLLTEPGNGLEHLQGVTDNSSLSCAEATFVGSAVPSPF